MGEGRLKEIIIGEKKVLQAFAEEYRLNKVTLLDRLDRGWKAEIALLAPGGNRGRKYAYWKKLFDNGEL